MRVSILTAGFLVTSALLMAGLPAAAHQAKVTCLCDCPDDARHKVKAHAAPQHHAMRRAPRRSYAGNAYDYGAFGGVNQNGWHGEWRQARNDGMVAPPPYGYDQGDDEAGLHVDDRGWTGGVGGVAHGGGGGGGGGDLGGSVVLANGGSAENGPTYNSYGESFQFNPSQAGPFQNRLMGGFAPSK
jgi:hypothetical protein